MKKLFAVWCLISISSAVITQNRITGTIISQDSLPLFGATIFIPDLNKGTISDADGKYVIGDLPNGEAKIQYSYMGCFTRIETVEFDRHDVVLDILMKQSAIEVDEVVVSGLRIISIPIIIRSDWMNLESPMRK